ncbi:MAG: TIGR04255 family protein [Chloroflexota bacterium]|nr:TIGR04255 family protein [Chloroflexota bacterium]
MTGVYRNPPVIEAVCEFRFQPDSAWDLAMPGLIYEKVRRSFPVRQQPVQLSIAIGGPSSEPPPIFEPMPVMRFLRKDEKALIQVGPQLLSVNQLKPYRNWSTFRKMIENALAVYREVAQPKSVQRIGLRYINRIELGSPAVRLEDYFEFRPFLGDGLPQHYTEFYVAVQTPNEDQRDRLKMQLTNTANLPPGGPAFALDLEYFLANPGTVDLEGAMAWVELAHRYVEEAFEASTTPQLREEFGRSQAR